jgi:hypothetical protein
MSAEDQPRVEHDDESILLEIMDLEKDARRNAQCFKGSKENETRCQHNGAETSSIPRPQEPDLTPPNGGYGWICVVTVFFINMHTWGLNSVSFHFGIGEIGCLDDKHLELHRRELFTNFKSISSRTESFSLIIYQVICFLGLLESILLSLEDYPFHKLCSFLLSQQHRLDCLAQELRC